MSKIILCDVDLTVVDPIPLWWQWLEIRTGKRISYTDLYGIYRRTGTRITYNIGEIFREAAGGWLGFDTADFWRNEGIYDLMRPIPAAVDILKRLHTEGYEIRFVSHCKGNHHKSKYEFLERNFPFMSGFAATKEKYMLHADIFIDDRNDHLNKMPDHVLKFQPETPYKQDENIEGAAYINCDWNRIYNIITTREINDAKECI